MEDKKEELETTTKLYMELSITGMAKLQSRPIYAVIWVKNK